MNRDELAARVLELRDRDRAGRGRRPASSRASTSATSSTSTRWTRSTSRSRCIANSGVDVPETEYAQLASLDKCVAYLAEPRIGRESSCRAAGLRYKVAMLDVRNLTKSYGGPSGRRVLDGVAAAGPAGRVRRDRRRVGRRQVHAAQPRRRTRRARLRRGPARGARPRAARRERPHALRRSRMGFVFQAFHLLPHLSVARNVGLPLALNGQAGPAAAERACRNCSQAVGLGGPRRQPAARTVGRRDAARGRGARARAPARAGAGRRAHRQPRSRQCRDDPRDPARADQARQRGRRARHALGERRRPRPTASTSSRGRGCTSAARRVTP